MNDNTNAYLCKQLQAALDDAPGGEKAWVPLRRSLVQACIDELHAAGAAVALMDELRALLERAKWTGSKPMQADVPDSGGAVDREHWHELPFEARTDLIRRAVNGKPVGWLPSRRAWARHYPAAFYGNGEVHE